MTELTTPAAASPSAGRVARFAAAASHISFSNVSTISLTLRQEAVVVIAASIAFGAGAIALAVSSTPVYLTPDGAHAASNAFGLISSMPVAYLPGWPAILLPFLLVGLGTIVALQVAQAFVLAALFGGLYALGRQFVAPRAAFLGAVAGAMSTSVAELLGWQGAATLVGLTSTVWALVFLERWIITSRPRDAFLTGAAFAVVMASHPFMTAIAVGLLGLRWLALLYQRRRFGWRGWTATSLSGLAVAAILPGITLLLLFSRYTSSLDAPAGSALRLPETAATIAQLTWITREGPALFGLTLLLAGAALAAPLAMRSIAFGVVVVFVALPAMLSGDPSYQSRVVYLLPIVLTLGGAWLWRTIDNSLLRSRFNGMAGRAGRAASVGVFVAPLVAASLVGSLGFTTRLPAAAAFYARLEPADASLLSSLTGKGAGGTILTSWTTYRYWDGMGKSWFVEGLSKRAAIGPTDPAMSVRPAERADEAVAWQLFSAQQGMQNGSLQVGFGPGGWHADPAIAAMVGGNYVPLVYINDSVNQYGVTNGKTKPLAWKLGSDGSATGSRASGFSPLVTTTASLDRNALSLHWSRGAAAPIRDWTIYVWPQYGVHWNAVQVSGQSALITPQGGAALHSLAGWDAADPRITVSISGKSSLRYLAKDPRFDLQAIVITVPAGSSLDAVISVSGTAQAGPVETYDERSLLAQKHVTTAVVWRNTLWASRFMTSPCSAAAASDEQIQTFDVVPACRP
jgi:hypothetical protein